MSDQEKKDETDLDKVLPDESYSLNEPVIEKIFGFANLTDLKLKLFSPNHYNYKLDWWVYWLVGILTIVVFIIYATI